MFQGGASSSSSSSNQLPYYQHGFAPSNDTYGYNQPSGSAASSKKSTTDLIKYKNMTDSGTDVEGAKKSEIHSSADFEYNQKIEDDQNSMDSSMSSSASSESENPEKIKEAIRRFAEGTKNNQEAVRSYEKAMNRKTSMDDLGRL